MFNFVNSVAASKAEWKMLHAVRALIHDGLHNSGIELMSWSAQDLGHCSYPSMFLADGVRGTHCDLTKHGTMILHSSKKREIKTRRNVSRWKGRRQRRVWRGGQTDSGLGAAALARLFLFKDGTRGPEVT